jgi:hypothetical protein
MKKIQMNNIIDKYIKRIKIDFPEDDKLMIDLQDFAKEIKSKQIEDAIKDLELNLNNNKQKRTETLIIITEQKRQLETLEIIKNK